MLNNYDILQERYELSKLLIDSLRNEIIEVNDIKTGTLNILLAETSVYKNELKNSYVIIEELRDIITKLTEADDV